MSADIITIY